jgi:hypothetical protein
MSGLVRALRKLILGETWTIPLGVGLTVAAGVAVGSAAGAVVLGGALLTLVLATRR